MKSLNRRQFVLGSGAAAAGAGVGAGEKAKGADRKRVRNILLLISDDHSPLAGCYGDPVRNMGRRSTEAVVHHAAEELYDIEADPMESTNLAEQSAYAGTPARLRGQVDQFRRRTGDPWLGYFERIGRPPEEPRTDR